MIDFIEVYDALPSDQCKLIIDSCEKGEWIEGLSGDCEVDKGIKDSLDQSHNFYHKTIVDNIILEAINTYTLEYIDKHPQTNSSIDQWAVEAPYNIQKYNPGCGYTHPHCETTDPTWPMVNRMLVWMINLNTVPDGGTCWTNYNKTIEAVEGQLIIWPSYWTHTHHGILSKNHTRYIATGWYSFIDEINNKKTISA